MDVFFVHAFARRNAIRMLANDKSRMYSGSFRNGKMIYGRLSPGEENSGKLVNMVREKAKQIAKGNGIETIILDGPPGIGCPVISTLSGVEKVVIVTEPTISGLHDMQRLMSIVQKFNIKAYVIINKYDLNLKMSDMIKKWCNENDITLAGELPFDKDMVEAMVGGKSITEFNPNNYISKKIQVIWNKIIN